MQNRIRMCYKTSFTARDRLDCKVLEDSNDYSLFEQMS